MPKILSFDAEAVRQNPASAILDAYVSKEKELEVAQEEFCKAVEDKWASTTDPDDVSKLLGPNWSSIIVMAAQTSSKDSRERLVEFLMRLTKRPDVTKDGKVCQVHDMTVWRELPTFGWSIRDAWNFNGSDDSDQDTKAHWVNINAFVASLLNADPSDKLGLSLFGLWTIRTAFEPSQEVSNVDVEAAAAWFAFASPTLKSFCNQQKPFDGKVAKPGDDFKDRNWRGFAEDRWQIWTQKLKEAQKQSFDTSAAELIDQACQAIAEV